MRILLFQTDKALKKLRSRKSQSTPTLSNQCASQHRCLARPDFLWPHLNDETGDGHCAPGLSEIQILGPDATPGVFYTKLPGRRGARTRRTPGPSAAAAPESLLPRGRQEGPGWLRASMRFGSRFSAPGPGAGSPSPPTLLYPPPPTLSLGAVGGWWRTRFGEQAHGGRGDTDPPINPAPGTVE